MNASLELKIVWNCSYQAILVVMWTQMGLAREPRLDWNGDSTGLPRGPNWIRMWMPTALARGP